MRKGWMRATLAFGIVGVTIVFSGGSAHAASVTANDDAGTTTAGQAVPIDVTANDSIDAGATTVTIAAPATTTNGSNAVSGLTLTYTPNVGFTGSDTFEYELCATFPNPEYGGGDISVCDTASVTVTVNADTAPLAPPPSMPTQPYGGGDAGALGTGSGGSLPRTGSGALLLSLLGVALVGGGICCYGAGRDTARALVR
jgi:hypothetical protein